METYVADCLLLIGAFMVDEGYFVPLEILTEIDCGSTLTSSARKRDLSISQTSKIISFLEKQWGVKLLDRSHKPATLTEKANNLMPEIYRLINTKRTLSEKLNQVRESNLKHNRIVISLPLNMERGVFINALYFVAEKYPELSFEVTLDSSMRAVLEGKVDIAWLGYIPNDERISWTPLGLNVSFLTATPCYLERYGELKSIEDLSKRVILQRNSFERASSNVLHSYDKEFLLPNSRLCRFGDADFCKTLLLSSQGIAVDLTPTFLGKELIEGTVVPVLPEWHRLWHINLAYRRDSLCTVKQEIIDAIRAVFDSSSVWNWKYWFANLNLPLDSIETTEPRKAFRL